MDRTEILKRGCVLAEAANVINGERMDQYGTPEDSFDLIASYWSIFLAANRGKALNPKRVAQMMVLLKIARMQYGEDKWDNYVDAAGYIGLAADAAFPHRSEPMQFTRDSE